MRTIKVISDSELPRPVPPSCVVGETLRQVRVLNEIEWAAIPVAQRPSPAEYFVGLGWVVAGPLRRGASLARQALDQRSSTVWALAQDALRLDPSNLRALEMMGILNDITDKYDEALRYYDAALAKAADHPRLLMRKARLLRLMGKPADAIAVIDRLEAMGRDVVNRSGMTDVDRIIPSVYAEAIATRAMARADLHDLAQAEKDYDTAVAEYPALNTLFNRAGFFYSDVHDYGRAVADFDAIIARSPQFPDVYYYRALALARMPEGLPKAIASLTQAIFKKPRDGKAYLKRGDFQRELGRRDEAERDYLAALSVDHQALQRAITVLMAKGYFLEDAMPASVTAPVEDGVRACTLDPSCRL